MKRSGGMQSLHTPEMTLTMKNGVQQSRNTPMMIPMVMAALCSCIRGLSLAPAALTPVTPPELSTALSTEREPFPATLASGARRSLRVTGFVWAWNGKSLGLK